MRLLWVGEVDGPELEKLLIARGWATYGRFYEPHKRLGGRCLNQVHGGGGFQHNIGPVFVYLIHKDESKMARLSVGRVT